MPIFSFVIFLMQLHLSLCCLCLACFSVFIAYFILFYSSFLFSFIFTLVNLQGEYANKLGYLQDQENQIYILPLVFLTSRFHFFYLVTAVILCLLTFQILCLTILNLSTFDSYHTIFQKKKKHQKHFTLLIKQHIHISQINGNGNGYRILS